MSKQFLDLPGLTTYHNNMKKYIPTQVPQSDWNQTTNTAKDYIKNKPTLGTASSKDVATTGNASSSQVVMGNDSRLTDSRPASDVSAWAKASTKPSYTASEVGLGNVGNYKAVSTVANQGLTSTEQSNSRTNIGLGTSSVKDVPTSGNASTTQVVMGNDTRVTDEPNLRAAFDALGLSVVNGMVCQTFTS